MPILEVIFFLTFIFASVVSKPCQQRAAEGGIICVCNADHCDTVEEVKKVEEGKFLIYTSNNDGLRFEKLEGDIANDQKKATPYQIIVRNESYQEIFGFGGAFTDSTCLNILSLDEPLQNELLRSYFSKEGIEYTVGRLPMGSTDFSLHPYTYQDEEDMTLSNFSLVSEDIDLKIPIIKRAKELSKHLELFVSTWTAPLWMKTNGEYAGAGGYLKKTMYQIWADYFVKFLDAYKEQNVTIWGITTGNEPNTGLMPVKIPAVAWSSSQMRQWVSENLGPSLRKSAHSNIKLLVLDDQRYELPWYVNEVFEDERARNYIDGIAIHWYFDNFFPADRLTQTHDLHSDKFILGTEACSGAAGPPHVLLGSWSRAEDYADSIIQDMNHWLVGWTDWNMALNMEGGPTYISNFVDSPIIVNAEKQEFYKQPMFYALGHFSKFVPRGSVRIYTSELDDKNVTATAFRRADDGVVVVILNKNDKPILMNVVDETVGTIDIELSSRSISSILYWP